MTHSARPVRLGLVGCGDAACTLHLPALQRIAAIDVVAVADPDAARRDAAAARYDIPSGYDDHQRLLEREEIDILAVCSPPHSHAAIARDAVTAGTHVFIEKPVGLALAEVDEVIAAAAAAGARTTVGLQLRCHRLVQRARDIVASGRLGPIASLRTSWTARRWPDEPPWRSRRDVGGGVLYDLGSHHFDLWRYLLDDDVVTVQAQTQHRPGDDVAAIVSGTTRRGALVSATLCRGGSDAHEIEIVGRDARLVLSPYRGDGLALFDPNAHTGGARARARRALHGVRNLPAIMRSARRGGPYREAYEAQWRIVAQAIQGPGPFHCTLADGRRALAITLAAMRAAESGTMVAIEPRSTAASRRSIETPPRRGELRLSVILVSPVGYHSLRRTVAALRRQRLSADIELIFALPEGAQLPLHELDGFHSHQIVHLGAGATHGAAVAAGVRRARAPVVVMGEDHCFPEPGWTGALLDAHEGAAAAVGPVVMNANPQTTTSRSDFATSYANWSDPMPAIKTSELPGHNSSYKRDLLLSYGSRLDELLDAQTLLHWELRRAGHLLRVEPAAVVMHVNFSRVGIWLETLWHAGRVFAACRATGWSLPKRVLYATGAPVIPVVRLIRIFRVLAQRPGLLRASLRDVPCMTLGLMTSALGEMLGYAGIRASGQRLYELEVDRIDAVTAADRASIEARWPVPDDDPDVPAQATASPAVAVQETGT